MPSVLKRFRTTSAEERAERGRKMEDVEAERDIVESIRADVANAAKVTSSYQRGSNKVRTTGPVFTLRFSCSGIESHSF